MTTEKSEQARKPVSIEMTAKEAIKEMKTIKVEDVSDPVELTAFLVGEERKSVLDAAQKIADNLPEPGEEEAPAPSPKKKVPSLDTIEEKYNDLLEEIAAFEVEQRRNKKHVNYFSRHRRQLLRSFLHFKKFTSR